MKKFRYTLIALSIVLWSCGGGGGDTPPPPPPVNNAPTTPTLVYPTDNLLCIENVLDFDWNASTDPDGDAVTYQVQVAKDAGFSQLVHTVTESSTLRTLSLEKGIAYYWRVRATDSKGASSSYSATNQFYTEGEGVSNHLPFTPVLVAPALNAVVSGAPTTTTLQWTADDVDNDELTYDVYFETGDTPTEQVAFDISVENFTVNIAASATYSWKVIVKDGQGGETIGQVWKFTTD